MGLTGYLLVTRPTAPKRDYTPEVIRRETRALSPVSSWRLYRNLRQRGPTQSPLQEDVAYAEALLRHRIHEGVALLVLCVGIGLIVVAVTKKKIKGNRARH